MSHAVCCPQLYYPYPGSMRCDAVIIGLEPTEMAAVDAEWHVRENSARERGGKHRYHAFAGSSPEEIERKQRSALAAELATAIWLRMEWTGVGKQFGRPDVGWLYEVRHSQPWGNSLIIHSHDKGIAVYVDGVPPAVVLRGWMTVRDAQAERYWREDIPHHAFMVPQNELHDLRRLVKGELTRGEVLARYCDTLGVAPR